MKLMTVLNKTVFQMKKNSPLILTIGGVLGLGATAVLSYKASKKVETIVEDLEVYNSMEETITELEAQAAEHGILSEEKQYVLNDTRNTMAAWKNYGDKTVVVRDIAGAVALPVVTGIASVTCIALSYYIMNSRNNMLATALGTAMAEYRFYRSRVAEEYGEEVDNRMATPVEYKPTKVKGEDGKKVDVDTPLYRRSLNGEWYNQSSEYTIDDHSYNMQFIKTVEEKLQMRMFRKGYLRMNEVNDALGFSRTQYGETLGWNAATGFNLETTITRVTEPDNWVHQEIYIGWPEPKSIYHDVDYEGRYAQ